MFYRIDCERLNEIINENNQFSRNGETRFRETVKPNFAEEGKPSPRTRETPRRGEGKTNFDLQRIQQRLLQNTTESKNTIGASADASAPARSSRQDIHRNLNRPGRNIQNVLVVLKIRSLQSLESPAQGGIKPEAMLDGVKRYAAWVRATGNTGTQFVKQAATFFGPDRHFEDSCNSRPLPEVGDSDRSMSCWPGAMSDKFGKSSDKLTF